MTTRTLWFLTFAVVCTGCYRSHEPGWAATGEMLLDRGWLAGDLGEVEGFASDAYAIELNDRRADGSGSLLVKLHSGQRGGDAHGWSMVGLVFRGVDPLDDRFAPGAREVIERTGDAPVDLWACSGPAHGVQIFEDEMVRLVIETEAGAGISERVFTFEAELSEGQRVEGGFSVSPR